MSKIEARPNIIFNPFARSEKASRHWFELYRTATRAKIRLSDGPGGAEAKAAKAVQRGATAVIAAGGDGTINEVVNGIMGKGVPLGVIPVGSVNVLARELGIPLAITGAWDVIQKGHAVAVDLIRVDYRQKGKSKIRYGIQLAGVGLDAHIVQRVGAKQKKFWGPWSYVWESFRTISKTLPTFDVKVDGVDFGRNSFVLIGNGRYYGGSFSVFPQASMTDGLLDICVFESAGYLDLMIYLQAMVRGKQNSISGVRCLQGKTIEISSLLENVPFEMDGEFIGYAPLKISITPSAMKIFVPE
jgi:YegS/Rv2252/BmrU family lipid kinase